MFERFNRSNTMGSKGNASESAFCCASFKFILFVIDAALAVSIFVFAEILGLGLIVSILLCVVLAVILVLSGLIILDSPQTRPTPSAA